MLSSRQIAHPARRYFLLTFAMSWAAAGAVAARDLLRGEAPTRLTAILIGPSAIGVAMTYATRGREGGPTLWARLTRRRFAGRWYELLLIPTVLVPLVLWGTARTISPAFTPNAYWTGVLFGLPAGFLEEIGWTEFAYPAMLAGRGRRSAFFVAVELGLVWALWHLPVNDYLGAAHPHGRDWLPFFLASRRSCARFEY